MYRWVSLKKFLVIPRRQFILFTLILCTAVFLKMFLSISRRQDNLLTLQYVQLGYPEHFLNYTDESVHTAHITTIKSRVILEMFLVILLRQNILLTLLLCTALLFWYFQLLCGENTYLSHYYDVQLSFSLNVLSYSEDTVHAVQFTTTYNWFFLKKFLFFWGNRTYCSYFYYVHLKYSEKYLVILRWQNLLLSLLLCTVDFFENVLCDTQDRVNTAHITTVHSWVFLKMFLDFLRRLYILISLLLLTTEFFESVFSYSEGQDIQLTLLRFTAKIFWKCSFLIWGDSTYIPRY